MYKNLCIRAVRAHTLLVLLYGGVQMSSCTGTCMSVRCEPTTVLCSFPLRSYRGTKHSRGTSTPACLMRTPAVKNYILGTAYVLSSGMYPYPPGAGKHVLAGQRSGKIEVQYRCIRLSGESSGTCTLCLSPRPRLLRAVGLP